MSETLPVFVSRHAMERYNARVDALATWHQIASAARAARPIKKRERAWFAGTVGKHSDVLADDTSFYVVRRLPDRLLVVTVLLKENVRQLAAAMYANRKLTEGNPRRAPRRG